MTWKSYAAVSGATVLAGWLASSPPSNAPATGTTAASSPAPRRRAEAATDIEEQAARLQFRMRVARAYSEPQRNPFRFAQRPSAAANSRELVPVVEAPPPIDVPPAGPRVSVAGIAEEQLDGRIERTAILSSPMGVLLVHEGDTILDDYRVGAIEAESVELVRVSDGTSTRLTLGTPQP
jgi:hypothetical protein